CCAGQGADRRGQPRHLREHRRVPREARLRPGLRPRRRHRHEPGADQPVRRHRPGPDDPAHGRPHLVPEAAGRRRDRDPRAHAHGEGHARRPAQGLRRRRRRLPGQTVRAAGAARAHPRPVQAQPPQRRQPAGRRRPDLEPLHAAGAPGGAAHRDEPGRHEVAAAIDGGVAVGRGSRRTRNAAVGRRAARWRCAPLAHVQAAPGHRPAVRPAADPYRASHRIPDRGGRPVVPRHSLRKRVEYAFALCVVGLSVAWGLAFYGAIRLSEDRVLANQLQRAAEDYPDLTTSLRGYEDPASLPKPLRKWGQAGPREGLYEFVDEELHVAVVPAGNAQGRAFVVFDVAGIEAASSEDWWWLLVITGVVVLLGALGFGLGVLVMRRAVAPVVQLADVVAGIDLEHLSAGDHELIESGRFGKDEVAVLAGAIEKTLERISAFIVRERDFTGSASHELRTPITVITGAIELLEQGDLSAE